MKQKWVLSDYFQKMSCTDTQTNRNNYFLYDELKNVVITKSDQLIKLFIVLDLVSRSFTSAVVYL